MIAIGIDAGSTTTKIVGIDGEGTLCWHRIESTEPVIEEQAAQLLASAKLEAGEDLPVVATGYGRKLVATARKTRQVTEITCHAAGVFRLLGHGGTLIDIGGQDSKVIVIGDNGKVSNFGMNDKCAAGTGRFLEVTAQRLRKSLQQMSDAVLNAAQEVPISNTCTVFAESEIVSLIARGKPVDQIARGLYRSLIGRVGALVRNVGIKPPLMISGGVAQSPAVIALLSEELGAPIEVPEHPQLMGAYGAALLAQQ